MMRREGVRVATSFPSAQRPPERGSVQTSALQASYTVGSHEESNPDIRLWTDWREVIWAFQSPSVMHFCILPSFLRLYAPPFRTKHKELGRISYFVRAREFEGVGGGGGGGGMGGVGDT